MKMTKYNFFGKEVSIPLVTYSNGQRDDVPNERFQYTLYICVGEDWYALSSPQLHKKVVRIVDEKVCQQARIEQYPERYPF